MKEEGKERGRRGEREWREGGRTPAGRELSSSSLQLQAPLVNSHPMGS